MRQYFDVGDIIEYNNLKGCIVESKPIIKNKSSRTLHVDEYRCKVLFFGQEKPQWVRAKFLKHISKIN